MQPWAGGRRERERSSSVVLLGKLSAIVRRGSLFQADPEDARGSSSSSGSYEDKDGDATATTATARHARRSSIAGTPTQSGMTLWDPRASGSGAGVRAQRFQFYPTRTLVAAALAPPLTPEELARRGELEAQLGDFAAMHAGFAPAVLLSDEQEEKEEAVEAQDAEQQEEGEEMDNNQQETLEEEERRAAIDADEEEEIEEAERTGVFADDEELLDFDPVNMPASVRTLMNRIKSESLLSESEAPFAHAVSNQEEEDDGDSDEDDDEDVDLIDDVEELDLDNNNAEHDEERSSAEEEETIAQVEQELVQELSPAEHRLLQRRRTRLLSCAAERAALTAQDQLTSSVRRLVIQLKDDSDQLRQPLTQSHGIRCKPKESLRDTPTRRRAGSCPNSYDLGLDGFLSSHDVSPMPTPPAISPALVPQDVHPGKKQKKSAFSRLGPRVLETLHLRKKRKTYLFTDEELESIEGARWKIVELAFRFGGKHRSYLVQAINMFFPLLNGSTNVVD
ncbi:Pleckstrin homology-like domain [Phytophthora cinnamomi]|uniref:Pleckstrin homology-like domain n=1 Tax=Phytophthora cinnamomi TaxID=4785 RepID=UPI003559B530|nr:Pleckstrin homology-like domain [Phytophthora cinnamomi]